MSRTTPHREEVLHLVREERARQVQQYGSNASLLKWFGNTLPIYPWLSPFSRVDADEVQRMFRQDYEEHVQSHGQPTWMHLIREEVAEMFEASRPEDVIVETVQVAALCVSLVELLLETPREISNDINDR